MSIPVIKIDTLTKFYGKKVGYLGPNAAGKTTTIRIFIEIVSSLFGILLLQWCPSLD